MNTHSATAQADPNIALATFRPLNLGIRPSTAFHVPMEVRLPKA